jgi:nucleoside-diphosphate-sugar epimerase
MSDERSALSGRSAIVTGASGFIGTHLCRRLRDAGVEVHGVSRTGSGHAHVAQWWRADLADPHETRSIMRQVSPDLVFHLASQVGGSRALDWVVPTVKNNLLSTVYLLAAAAETGCNRIVLAGSMEEPTDPVAAIPSSPYAAAKSASTAYARMFHALYDLPVVVLRLFMVYGPEQRDHTKLIPYVGLSLYRGETPELGSGRRLVDWVYVDDVTEAFVTAAATDGVEGETFDVGTGELVSVRAVVEKLTLLIDPSIRPRFGAVPDRPFESSPRADVDKSFLSLDWRARVPLDEGLRKTASWLRNVSSSHEDSTMGKEDFVRGA